ncbi:MAG: extracellular matrix regulator RemB [Dethiobacteraceae bacterium]|nr:DUF370 domain-containing protein [Bacillota bacterium]
MFLHIGGSRIVAGKDIIGIFDIRLQEKQCNKEFLQSAPKITDLSKEEIKTFLVTNDGVLFSPIAAGTLKKRFQTNNLTAAEK